jgi:hypothetical protein
MLMLTSDSFLFDAGWLFFAAWSVIIAVVRLTAFRRDFLQPGAHIQLANRDQSTKTSQSSEARLG